MTKADRERIKQRAAELKQGKELARVYADFQKLDDDNRLILSCRGTLRDLERLGIQLQEGLRLTFYTDDANSEGRSDEIRADGLVHFDKAACQWVATIDWDRLGRVAKSPAVVLPQPSAKKKAKETGPKLTHKCGHVKGIKEYENIDCPTCRDAARRERAARRRERQPKTVHEPYTIGRLPHGSRYEKVYDAEQTSWSGSLTIPDAPTFAGTASAEKKLEHLLDRQYREWLTGSVQSSGELQKSVDAVAFRPAP